jgi:hypothetical protein
VLLDVRQGHWLRQSAVDQVAITRQQPRLMYEQTVVGAAGDEAVASRRQHSAALTGVKCVVARPQPHEKVTAFFSHRVAILMVFWR